MEFKDFISNQKLKTNDDFIDNKSFKRNVYLQTNNKNKDLLIFNNNYNRNYINNINYNKTLINDNKLIENNEIVENRTLTNNNNYLYNDYINNDYIINSNYINNKGKINVLQNNNKLTIMEILRKFWDNYNKALISNTMIRGHVCRAVKSRMKKLTKRTNGKEGNVCNHCQTSTTTLWRRFGDSVVCNACGLYYKIHGTKRPSFLQTDGIRRRKKRSNRK